MYLEDNKGNEFLNMLREIQIKILFQHSLLLNVVRNVVQSAISVDRIKEFFEYPYRCFSTNSKGASNIRCNSKPKRCLF